MLTRFRSRATLPDVTKRRRRRWSVARLALWTLRALIAVLVMQFAGITHELVDAVRDVEGVALHESADDCPFDDQGDCPPGCPDCHACHGMWAIPPSVEAPLVMPFDVGELGLLAYEAQGPPGVTLSLERPPRS
jgi:hypothetical protein